MRILSERDFRRMLDRDNPNQAVIEAQGDDHEDIDMRLVEKIDAYLAPILGDWESSEVWWHNLAVHGHGIRSLLFSESAFDPGFIDTLQGFLTGEHEPFCILCQVFESLGDDDENRVGSIAIFHDHITLSRPLARKLSLTA